MNIRYPIYEGVYRILTILLLIQYRHIKNHPCFLPATCGRKETRVYHQAVFSIPLLYYVWLVVFPAQIFIQVLISGIFMREVAYTDSVFVL